MITELVEKNQPVSAKASLTERLTGQLREELEALEAFNDPQGIYARMPVGLKVQ